MKPAKIDIDSRFHKSIFGLVAGKYDLAFLGVDIMKTIMI